MGSKHHEEFDYSTPCACGQGTLDHYKLIIDLDFPPFEKIQNGPTKVNCKNPNCPSKK